MRRKRRVNFRLGELARLLLLILAAPIIEFLWSLYAN